MFKSYFSELSKLDKEDVTLLMDYYHEQSILLEREIYVTEDEKW
ncbi:hypothetical protein ECZU31_35170 [Escherichia coli]|nr:hypothetical protein ECZU31_35170 [Escherichia coli]